MTAQRLGLRFEMSNRRQAWDVGLTQRIARGCAAYMFAISGYLVEVLPLSMESTGPAHAHFIAERAELQQAMQFSLQNIRTGPGLASSVS